MTLTSIVALFVAVAVLWMIVAGVCVLFNVLLGMLGDDDDPNT